MCVSHIYRTQNGRGIERERREGRGHNKVEWREIAASLAIDKEGLRYMNE